MTELNGQWGMSLDHIADEVVVICQQASEAILSIYHQSDDAFQVNKKADCSPVTQADLAASQIIEKALRDLCPGIPIICEEISLPAYAKRRDWSHYWLVDPLDGTKEFIRRNDQFTVNIALIEEGKAIMGVVYVPVSQVAYLGVEGYGAFKIGGGEKQGIACRDLPRSTLSVVASKHHNNAETDAVIAALKNDWPQLELCSVGSSLKFCLLAEGLADIYPRFAPTCEWDTAAAQAVLEAAGGRVYRADHQVLRYNEKDSILNPSFYAVADPSYNWRPIFENK